MIKIGQNILKIFLQRRMRHLNEIRNVFSAWFPELCQLLQYFLELRKGLVSRYREGWWKQEEKKEIKGHLAPLVKSDKCITRFNGSTGVMGIKGDKGDDVCSWHCCLWYLNDLIAWIVHCHRPTGNSVCGKIWMMIETVERLRYRNI